MFSVTIQLSYIEGVPHCFYPKDYGYTVKVTEENDTGMTVDIIRNNKYRSSGRPDSPDIDTLRVDIRYHSSDMLQFKVCVCFRQWCKSFFLWLSAFHLQFFLFCFFYINTTIPTHTDTLTYPRRSDLGPDHRSL